MAIALYPGGFKPPHRGHYEVVEKLLNGTHNGVVYGLDDYKDAATRKLGGGQDKVEKIDKVIIFIGGGERNGISVEDSKKIWEIYKKHLGNVEIYHKVPNPMLNALTYARKHPEEKMYAVTGIRDEADTKDLRRISTFKSTPNVQGLAIGGDEKETRASDLRTAILDGNLDKVLDFFPQKITRQEILKIINMLKQSIIAENMLSAVNKTLDEMFKSNPTDEGSSGTPVAPRSVIPSELKADLADLYTDLSNKLADQPYSVEFQQDRIIIKPGEGKYDQKPFDYTPYMTSILEYMIKEKGMTLQPIPEIKIKRDIEEAKNLFGRTAYYDPNIKEVVLYVEGRHPKDVLRSFVHEMIHHTQNLEGRLGTITTSNTNESEHLKEIEQEAHYGGSMIFREWEDKYKNT